jgi:hypothetical protein
MRAETHEERLLSFLFEEQGYRSVARAVMDTSKTVTVSIDFVLLRIHGLVSTRFVTAQHYIAALPISFSKNIYIYIYMTLSRKGVIRELNPVAHLIVLHTDGNESCDSIYISILHL